SVLEALRSQEEKERRTVGEAPKAEPLPGFQWPTPWDFTAYVESKREGFVGREWLFTEIEDWLKNGTHKALLIRADFGVGKPAMMAEILRRNPGGAVAAAHFCQHDTKDTLYPGTFVRSLAAQFRESIPGYREAVEGDAALQERLDSAPDTPAGAFEAAILNMLAKLPRRQALACFWLTQSTRGWNWTMRPHARPARLSHSLLQRLHASLRGCVSW